MTTPLQQVVLEMLASPPDAEDPAALSEWMGRLVQQVNENFRKVGDYTRVQTENPTMEGVARTSGGESFEVQLGTSADTTLSHGLKRIPSAIMSSFAVDGSGGHVIGNPEGGGPAGPGFNTAPWTATSVSVRATVAGTYRFMVI